MADNNYYHNKGEKDGSNYEYNPPVVGNFYKEVTATERDWENQQQYDKGWENAKNQRD